MSKAKVFMIMPFKEEYFEVYNMLKTKFFEVFEFSNAGDEDNQQNILRDIIQPIYESDLIIADLTGLNPNVLYELGIAHSFGKKTIVISKDNLDLLPFDLKQYRAKNYDTHFLKFDALLKYLEKHLNGAISNEIIFGNPVSDFLDRIPQNDRAVLFSKQNINIDLNEGEKGFLDFLTDLEDDASELTDNIDKMVSALKKMTDGVEESTKKIENAKKTAGEGHASFVRKEAKKVANIMINFNNEFSNHNLSFRDLWNRIETNILGLMENDLATSADNIDGFRNYIRELHNIQGAIYSSNEGIISMQEAINGNKGLERSMNQAIKLLDDEMNNYLGITEQISSSIERIKSKSKFVLGIIDYQSVEVAT